MNVPDNPPGAQPIQLAPRTPDEPTITLPQPPGWEFMPGKDETSIRGIVYNQDLRLHGFTPNAVVTLEELTGQAGVPSQALAKERAAIIDIVGEIDTESPGTVSGFASRTIDYNLQGRAATGLIVAIQNAKNRIWAVTVTIQTTDADNPHYVTAKKSILDSLEVRLPEQ